MKKRNLSQKLKIQKSKIASFDQIHAVNGGLSNPCDSIETMQCTVNCPTNGCPPGSNGCNNTVNCPPPPSANTVCRCESIITMAGVTGC